jgi:hypothetical protein
MRSQAYNLIWIRPDFAKEGEKFTQPIKQEYLDNLVGICMINSGVDVRFWVDMERLSEEQRSWLQAKIDEIGMSKLEVLDLRSIELYKNDHIFRVEGTDNRRIAQEQDIEHIYGAVDAAKLLVCTQGDYDQQYVVDLNINWLDVNSEIVQEKLMHVGVLIGGGNVKYENQILAFNRSRIGLAYDLFDETRRLADEGQTGWDAIGRLVDGLKRKGFDLADFAIREQDFELIDEDKEGAVMTEAGAEVSKI